MNKLEINVFCVKNSEFYRKLGRFLIENVDKFNKVAKFKFHKLDKPFIGNKMREIGIKHIPCLYVSGEIIEEKQIASYLCNLIVPSKTKEVFSFEDIMEREKQQFLAGKKDDDDMPDDFNKEINMKMKKDEQIRNDNRNKIRSMINPNVMNKDDLNIINDITGIVDVNNSDQEEQEWDDYFVKNLRN